MNDLSWLLYLAGVSSGLQAFFGVFGSIAGIGLLGAAVVFFFSDPEDEYDKGDLRKARRALRIFGPLSVSFLLIAVSLPDKNTIYLIAGSEMTEEAVVSETGQEVLGYLKNAVTHQLKELSE